MSNALLNIVDDLGIEINPCHNCKMIGVWNCLACKHSKSRISSRVGKNLDDVASELGIESI